ncbi:hypothetical protein SCHPADRAFT_933306 [Schizopora paradoxa]|uniref:VWFA domain-containing protein n=1 Tax=Schizopora paradoxa TaxID=27342 RepID=A0A0H2R968_9AGAM|nr:hypothetical protein SCHPADRAFT_933306 [Schizopora paradoxa]
MASVSWQSIAHYQALSPRSFELSYPPMPRSIDRDNARKLQLLPYYNTVFLIDDSLSMMFTRNNDEKANWAIVEIWLGVMAEIAARYNPNGIEIRFFHSREIGRGIKDRNGVRNLFSKVFWFTTGTPTKTSISVVLDEYFSGYRLTPQGLEMPKALNLIVITDGAPSSPSEDPTGVILNCIQWLDQYGVPVNDREVGITFAQVGRDPRATLFRSRQDIIHHMPSMRRNQRKIVYTLKSKLNSVVLSNNDYNRKVIKLLLGVIDKT